MAQPEDAGKMFVGGISSETSQAGLTEYFEQFGEVINSVLMLDNVTKKSRGFGFITYRDAVSVLKVEECTSHILDGKQIDPKRAVPKGPGQSAILKQMNEHTWSAPGSGGGGYVGGGSRSKNPNKIFVGGVGPATDEEQLNQYFSTFGEVLEVRMPVDKKTEKRRGFAFVTFQSAEPVARTRSIHYHMVNGKTVEVKSIDQSQSTNGRPQMGGYGNSYGEALNGAQSNYLYTAAAQNYSQQLRAYAGAGYGAGYGLTPPAGYGQTPGASSAAQSSPYAGLYGGAGAGVYGDHHALAYGHPAVSAYGASSYSSLAATPASSLTAGYGGGISSASAAQHAAATAAQQSLSESAMAEYRSNPLYGLGSYAQDVSKYGPSRAALTGAAVASSLSNYSAAVSPAAAALAAAQYPGSSLAAAVASGLYGRGYGAESGAATAAAIYGRSAAAALASPAHRGFHPYGR